MVAVNLPVLASPRLQETRNAQNARVYHAKVYFDVLIRSLYTGVQGYWLMKYQVGSQLSEVCYCISLIIS